MSVDTRDGENLASIPSNILDEPAPDREIPIRDPETGEVTGFKKLKVLNLREELFVREYMKDFDSKATAKRLSIKQSAAIGFLTRKHVRAKIQEKAEKQFRTLEMDSQWVMSNLREVIERCMDEEKFDASNALRGLEMVGKRFAMFTDKVEVNNKTVIRIESNVGDILSGVIDVTPVAPAVGVLEKIGAGE